MGNNYTGTASNIADPTVALVITEPADSDAQAAATYNLAFSRLADMVEHIRPGIGATYGNSGAAGVAVPLAFDGVSAVGGFNLVGSTYTASQDISCTSAVISANVIVQMNGYRFYCTGLLDMSAANCVLAADGKAASGATAGAAQGGILASGSGNAGVAGVVGAGNGGTTSVSNTLSSGWGGAGGASGGGHPGGAASTTSTLSSGVVPPTFITGIAFLGTYTVLQGGAGGASGGSEAGGTSGGGGGGGGLLIVATQRLKLSASAILGARGGAGGNATAGNAGGGGGGGGGTVILTYRSLASGSTDPVTGLRLITTGGAGGAGSGTGSAGGNGLTGGAYINRG